MYIIFWLLWNNLCTVLWFWLYQNIFVSLDRWRVIASISEQPHIIKQLLYNDRDVFFRCLSLHAYSSIMWHWSDCVHPCIGKVPQFYIKFILDGVTADKWCIVYLLLSKKLSISHILYFLFIEGFPGTSSTGQRRYFCIWWFLDRMGRASRYSCRHQFWTIDGYYEKINSQHMHVSFYIKLP